MLREMLLLISQNVDFFCRELFLDNFLTQRKINQFALTQVLFCVCVGGGGGGPA